MKNIGFLGLGLMGSRMAGRLIDEGFELTVYNRTRDRMKPLIERGARAASTPREAAAASQVTITMLLDGDAVRDVLSGPSPGEGVLDGLETGNIHIDMSTVGKKASLELSQMVQATGASFLDVPVLGSIGPAEKGTLLLLAGGESSVLDRARDILSVMGTRIIHAGGVGQGSALKMVANMMLARMVDALGEALALGIGQELSPETVVEMLQAGALSSPMWDKAEAVRNGSPPLHFPITHMVKDLRLVSETARSGKLDLPVLETVRNLFETAAAEGNGSKDYSWLASWLLEKNAAGRR
jgi:3-hydroxyisobutyrate dehydrogenase-like beta-hydroxyacid dehydrogenase